MQILNILLVLTSFYLTNEDLYKTAENYIIHSKEVSKFFFPYTSDSSYVEFCISEDIISPNRTFFLDEIIEFSFSNESEERKKQIRDSLICADLKDKNQNDKYEYFKETKDLGDCDLFIIFSKIQNECLYAEVVYSTNKSYEYKEIIKNAIVGIEFYFVFNEGKIEKIFSKEIAF